MVEKDENRLRVTLRTMVNGYLLEVNDEGYMYYNPKKMLEGFLIHVGMLRLEEMTQDEIKDMLKALKDGGVVKKLQAEVTQLKAQVTELKNVIRDQKREMKNNKKSFIV